MVHWLDRKSRMKREFHVRFCERLEGWFLWSTRQLSHTQTTLKNACYLRRVCQAWHLTSQVQVLIPGIRRAEG